MADTKITALTALTAADPSTDVLPIVDTSDTTMAASGTTKKISINNILGASGTATLASATISGDLTVDTSTLKVDSANNRVGIGTASPQYPLDVRGGNISAGNGTIFGGISYSTRTSIGSFSNHDLDLITNGNVQYLVTTTGNHTWYNGGSTAMTLNSTGLGLGGIAAGLERFVVFSGASKMMSIDTNGTFFADGGTGKGRVTIENSSATNSILSTTTLFGAYNILKTAASQHQWFIGGSTQAMTLDASGNLGIGVAPSYKLDVSTGGVLGTPARLFGNDQSNVRLRFENTGASGRIWELVGGLDGSNNRWFSLRDVTGSRTPWGVDDSMNVISNVTGTAPTLLANSQMVFNLTSNTNLRISVRGTDGTTRTADITLA